MFRLIIENVRTFVDRVEIPLRPLTVLTGENSSGKTTFLAALAAVCDPHQFPFSPGFNEAPYNLGSFETIATYKGGKYGRAKSFTIGYRDDSPAAGSAHQAEATFRSKGGQPSLASFRLQSAKGSLVLAVRENKDPSITDTIEIDIQTEQRRIRHEVPSPIGERSLLLLDLLMPGRRIPLDDRESIDAITERIQAYGESLTLATVFAPPRAISIAPIRSKPERTYGQASNAFEPTSDHIPFLLERLVDQQPDSPDTRAVVTALTKFGDESGLFKKIEVRKLGKRPSDPFQLLVTLDGRAANLIDVGYGVSQALPVIVQSVLAAPETRLLLQQPEVHLHPRAQAGLGSFFTDLVARGGRQFVVETHSDFIIDRIRQHVASGELSTEDFLLLFFERRKGETVIHQLTLDRAGNTINAPRGYRDFFIQEEIRTLTRANEEEAEPSPAVWKLADGD